VRLAPLVVVLGVFAGLSSAGSARAQEDCLDCHDVDPEAVAGSVHGFLECLDCHPAAEELPHSDEIYDAACGDCHDDLTEQYASSVHGVQGGAGDPMVTGCEGCHGPAHAMLPGTDPQAPTHPLRQPEVCGGCHASAELAAREQIHLVLPVESYTQSIHSRALKMGEDAASCSDCHGSHAILRSSDHDSWVHHDHISETCSHCHAEIAAQYDQSVHGIAAAQGVRESPVCTDCHGEHRILEPHHADSPVHPTNIPKVTCERCHADVKLNEKYGLAADKVPSFEQSYHGLASRFGIASVANCSSCHGVHDILPSSDPRAHTHPENLDETCGQCHPGAGQRFAIGPIHVIDTEAEHPAVFWVRTLYIWTITLVIGFMLFHNSFDLYRKTKQPPLRPTLDEVPDRVRMSRGFRVAHALMGGSFVVLTYSGFALTYPEAWWASPLHAWEESYDIRGWIHRVAALVMVASAVVHIAHLATDRAARRCAWRFIPRPADLYELKERMQWFFGRRPDPPKAPWVGYPEKMEYGGVVWGTLVMTVTGFALWFEDFMLRWFPTWIMDLSTTIHFWEAVLAGLSIFVWHFYAVIFDPAVYPVDPAWLTGRSAPGREHERLGPDEPEPVHDSRFARK
jgi:cytochrome b subunit of formate dehydrogenase